MKITLLGMGLSALSAAFLSGCATVEQSMQEQVATIPETQRAYVVGTYKVMCVARKQKCHPSFNSISAHYRNVSEKNIGGTLRIVEGGFDDTVFDFVSAEKQEKGIYFCHVIPAGEYSLFGYRYWNFAGGGSGYSLREENFFNVPFRAYAGEIVYIGDIKLTYSTGKNFIGLEMLGPGVVELSQGTAADVQLAVSKCPEHVRHLPLRSEPLEGQAGGHDLIVVKPAS